MVKFRVEWVVFYVGIPLVQAVLNGSRGSVYAADVGPEVLIPFWYVCSQTFWFSSAIFSYATKLALTQIPELLCALLGGVVGIALSYYYLGLLIGLSGDAVGSLGNLLLPGTLILQDSLISYVVGPTAVAGVVTWVIAFALRNRIKYGVWGISMSEGRSPNTNVAHSLTITPNNQRPPAFLAKLDPSLSGPVIAIEAQEHYVKVYTPKGAGLVLYRFRDALADLADWPGFRVHRSFWVAESAIEKVEGSGRTFTLTLKNDLRVPVSQSYRGVIEAAGLI